MERKLASVQVVIEKKPIENADLIEAVRINGWWMVVKKDEFQIGDKVCYLEIDSWVPNTIAPFLSKSKEPRVFENVPGERLKTIKLKGQISQGLVLPLSGLPNLPETLEEGDDLTAILGVLKWEPPEVGAFKAGLAKGNFPHFLRKTDQERVQNVGRTLEKHIGDRFEVTLKLDGSSMTVYHMEYDGQLYTGVCSRNIDLKDSEDSRFWQVAKKYNLQEKIKAVGYNVAIQGELISPSIQSNHEKVAEDQFYCFNVFDIDEQQYVSADIAKGLCLALDIPYVPIHSYLTLTEEHTVDKLLEMAEGPGMNQGVLREGLVFKSLNSDFSFKAISNSYLLKKG